MANKALVRTTAALLALALLAHAAAFSPAPAVARAHRRAAAAAPATTGRALALGAPLARRARPAHTLVTCTAESAGGGTLRNVTMGGGCFWCTEAVFQQLEAVTKVMPGYAGGTAANPTYKQVCRGGTGHAEVVQVTYDTTKASLADIYDLFFVAHDPTQVNRQGADVGLHYRSIILYEDEEQREEALKAIDRANEEYKDRKIFGLIPAAAKVATQVKPLDRFWPAESYHKDYFLNNPNMPYCAVNIGPKLRSFKVRSKISAMGAAQDLQ